MSDDDSGIGSSPVKRTKLRKILSSDSESEPSPGCSNWRDQPPNPARKLDSDSDSGEELEDHQNPRNPSNEKSNEKKEARRSQRNKMSAEKEKRLNSIRRLTAKRAGKRLSEDKSSENEDNSDPSTTPPPPDDSESSSCGDQSYHVAVDPIFPIVSQYPSLCRLPSCSYRFEIGITKIIGVYFDNDPDQEKVAWICAEHKYPHSDKITKENMELDDAERTKSDDDFIHDPEEGDNSNSVDQNSMDEITKRLRKETPEDIENAKEYMRQLRKYQLEPHNVKNKSLYTSEKKRYKRILRSAYHDVGMKDGSERSDPGLEFKLLKTQKKKGRKRQSKLSEFFSV